MTPEFLKEKENEKQDEHAGIFGQNLSIKDMPVLLEAKVKPLTVFDTKVQIEH